MASPRSGEPEIATISATDVDSHPFLNHKRGPEAVDLSDPETAPSSPKRTRQGDGIEAADTTDIEPSVESHRVIGHDSSNKAALETEQENAIISQATLNLPDLLPSVDAQPELAEPALRSPEITLSTTHSSGIVSTLVPENEKLPRVWYLKNYHSTQPPWIVHSQFVPRGIISHLMREKQDRAANGAKFQTMEYKFSQFERMEKKRLKKGCQPKTRPPILIPDKITNMEGALHTFVTPIVDDATIHGDHYFVEPQYQNRLSFLGKHKVAHLGMAEEVQMARKVIFSLQVQQDFRDDQVMAELASPLDCAVVGVPNPPALITSAEKQDEVKREEYDFHLRRFMIYHLTKDHCLPAGSIEMEDRAMNLSTAMFFLDRAIFAQHDLPAYMHNQYLYNTYKGEAVLLSLEVLFQTALHQILNELFLLEHLCAADGYNYTFDPPVIFTRFFQGSTSFRGTRLMSRIHIAALKHAARQIKLKALKVFAWNDFEVNEAFVWADAEGGEAHDENILNLLRAALASQPQVLVMLKKELFSKPCEVPKKTREIVNNRKIFSFDKVTANVLYSPPQGTENAALVIHNNSDGFGQNIEYEPMGFEGGYGSLDGAVGCTSSAAASVKRDRPDLCDHIVIRDTKWGG